jgi:hypothetical protein
MTRPDLLRSWVSDTLGAFAPAYVWHALAQEWQTPGAGEVAVALRFGPTATSRTGRPCSWTSGRRCRSDCETYGQDRVETASDPRSSLCGGTEFLTDVKPRVGS